MYVYNAYQLHSQCAQRFTVIKITKTSEKSGKRVNKHSFIINLLSKQPDATVKL